MAVKKLKNLIFKKRMKVEKVEEQASSSKVINLFNSKSYFYLDNEASINLKLVQVLFFAFFSSIVLNIFLACLILLMLPLKEKVPYFVHFLPKEEQIVVLEKFKTNKKAQLRILEFVSRDYVKKRETIDLTTEDERYPYVFYMSSNAIGNDFKEAYYPDENPKSPYKIAVDKNLRRNIKIISSSVVSKNTINVEFEAITYVNNTNKVLVDDIIIASIAFDEDVQEYKGTDYLNNPFGVVVIDYNLSTKSSKNNDNTNPFELKRVKNEDNN